jgi:DNA ligase-1
LVIVGALYGRGRRVGKYGAILLASYDRGSDIFRSTCKVGTGFTDEHLEYFFELRRNPVNAQTSQSRFRYANGCMV